jgi:hypothetical protein
VTVFVYGGMRPQLNSGPEAFWFLHGGVSPSSALHARCSGAGLQWQTVHMQHFVYVWESMLPKFV